MAGCMRYCTESSCASCPPSWRRNKGHLRHRQQPRTHTTDGDKREPAGVRRGIGRRASTLQGARRRWLAAAAGRRRGCIAALLSGAESRPRVRGPGRPRRR
eukprot:3585602-Rhodomonas_salina.2